MNSWNHCVGVALMLVFAAGASEFESTIRASYNAGDPVPTEVFKIRDKVEVHYFAPATPREPGNNPALVFIHGGGWKAGTPVEPYRWCRYLAERGVSAFSINYQVSSETLGIKPTQCLTDAKTAFRWVRANAQQFGIDPDRIAASGPSAGGHLSTALATIDGFNDPAEDRSVSCRPDLLLLVSPVMDNGPGGYGNGWDEKTSDTPDFRVKDFWRDFSPVHNLNHELPDTLVLMGDRDPLIRIDAVGRYGGAVEASDSDFEWIVFPGKGHGLFAQNKSYLTPELMHIYYAFQSFLAKHGYMSAPPPAGDEVSTLVRKQELAGTLKPNLIVILADDMGIGDIGAFRTLYLGKPKDEPESGVAGILPRIGGMQLAHNFTPNLDRLAKKGIRCTRAYSAAWCAPSRQMLLSGQWSSRRKAYDHPWVGKQLRDVGYATGFVGKSHGKKPTNKVYNNTNPQTAEFDDGLFFNNGARGFYMEAGETLPGRVGLKPVEFRAEADDYITDVFTDHAVEFVERHLNEPFMLYLPYTAPHEPLHGKPEDLKELFPEVFADRSNASIVAEVGDSKYRGVSEEMKAYHYAAMVYGLDRGIGRVMDTLKKHGIEQNTLVIFTCDNGAQWGSNYPGSGHKGDVMDGGIRVPFIVWSADIENSEVGGSVYNGLVSLADIAPTLVGEAGVKDYPYPTDGTNMMSYWTGAEKPPAGRAYFWSNISWGQSLTHKLTGAAAFSDEPLPGRKMSQSVYVKDDQKVMCWNLVGSDKTGAVYAKIPDVAGKENPAELVREGSPVAGQVPVEESGRELFDEMLQMISESESGLVPDWSGAPNLNEHSWWFIQ